MQKCLLDTDTLSLYMRGDASVEARVSQYLSIYPRLTFSIMTQYEILRGLKARQAGARERAFLALCQSSEILPLSTDIVVQAAEIYGELVPRGQLIGDSDILIAATALVHNVTVVSNNTKHFRRVPELSLENWHEVE